MKNSNTESKEISSSDKAGNRGVKSSTFQNHQKDWHGFTLRGSICIAAFLFGLVLIVLGDSPQSLINPNWKTPAGQLGLTLCITAVLYFVFQQIFDRANQDQVERIVYDAVKTVDSKIIKVDTSLEKLLAHNSILSGAFENNLICIYAKRDAGLQDIMKDSRNSKAVRMIGISLREYFMTSGHFNAEMDQLLDDVSKTDGKNFHALIINPNSDQATIRAERESDAPFDENYPYEDSGLYTDVKQSMKYLRGKYEEDKVEGRVYNSAPSCFLVITDTHTYIEQYHYGLPKSGLKGGHFPLLKFPTDSEVGRHLEGHFEYIWNDHSRKLPELISHHMVGVSKNAWECALMNLFPTRSHAEERIAYLLESATTEIKLIGISLRDFLHGGRKFYRILKKICSQKDADGKGVTIKVLCLDPFSEQGKIRSEREEPGVFPGNLHSEVITSLNSIKRLKESGDRVDVKLYSGAPNCFLVLTDKGVLVEQYHYGSDEPGATILGGKVPLFEFAYNSPTYLELAGHFDFIWSDKGPSITTKEWDEKQGSNFSKNRIAEPAA